MPSTLILLSTCWVRSSNAGQAGSNSCNTHLKGGPKPRLWSAAYHLIQSLKPTCLWSGRLRSHEKSHASELPGSPHISRAHFAAASASLILGWCNVNITRSCMVMKHLPGKNVTFISWSLVCTHPKMFDWPRSNLAVHRLHSP